MKEMEADIDDVIMTRDPPPVSACKQGPLEVILNPPCCITLKPLGSNSSNWHVLVEAVASKMPSFSVYDRHTKFGVSPLSSGVDKTNICLLLSPRLDHCP